MRLLFILGILSLNIELAQGRDFSRIFTKVDPAIVVIETSETNLEFSGKGVVQTTSRGLGSGVIVSNTGQILTASHVVHDANELTVELYDGRRLKARVLASVISADLAIIELIDPPENLTVAKLGDSDEIRIGEEVFVIGAPYGLEHTLTTGNLSGRRIQTDGVVFPKVEFLQTDAPINQGNSGGPMFNIRGEVIGIVSYIQSQSGGNEGLGFAASINMAKDVIIDQRALWWGMRYLPLNETMLRMLNVADYSEGLMVQSVAKGSLAAELGVKPGLLPVLLGDQQIFLGGDVILEIGGHAFYSTQKGFLRIQDYLKDKSSGDEIEVTVYRAGKKLILKGIKP